MRKLIVVLVLLLAVPAFAAKSKNKVKHKSFAPWTATLAEYAGTYRGPSDEHSLELQVSGSSLRGVYRENGRVAKVSPLTIDGTDFTAIAVFADGTRRELHGAFAIRNLNGVRAAGLRLRDVQVEGFGVIDTFFELTTSP